MVYTDNLHRDKGHLEQLLQEVHKMRNQATAQGWSGLDIAGPGGTYRVVVLQDVWHARMRVTKLLPKDHSLYKQAVGAWNHIFQGKEGNDVRGFGGVGVGG